MFSALGWMTVCQTQDGIQEGDESVQRVTTLGTTLKMNWRLKGEFTSETHHLRLREEPIDDTEDSRGYISIETLTLSHIETCFAPPCYAPHSLQSLCLFVWRCNTDEELTGGREWRVPRKRSSVCFSASARAMPDGAATKPDCVSFLSTIIVQFFLS